MTPETRYARSGDVNIAYQVVGDAPGDLVLMPGWVSNIEVQDRGSNALKGVPDEGRLFAVDPEGRRE